jgi:glutathione synthase/RimK-type ligase-like ATP-grasp enzyme
MNFVERASVPPSDPPEPIGLATLAKRAFDGLDLAPLSSELIRRMIAEPENAAVLMDLATIEHLYGNHGDAQDLQNRALDLQRLYRRPSAKPGQDEIRLLAFMAPGDFMANTPLEFLLEGSNVRLDMLYLAPGKPVPETLPDHDLAFVAVGESEENQALLRALEPVIRGWPRPVLNAPERISRLSREGTCELLRGAPGIAIPRTLRLDRQGMAQFGAGKIAPDDIQFPIIARPTGSHAGQGLTRLETQAALAAYLNEQPQSEFYVARFIDYRSADGMFRKYRVALIDGRPFASHMGVSQHWMIHYLNAGMRESAEKRAEEARWMAEFDRDFAQRHARAFEALCERVGLEYFGIDCGETPAGELLIFEADVAMIVHAMDPPDLFPYKRPQMLKVFDAFQAMLAKAAGRHSPARAPRAVPV